MALFEDKNCCFMWMALCVLVEALYISEIFYGYILLDKNRIFVPPIVFRLEVVGKIIDNA